MTGWIAIHRMLVSHDLWLSEKFTRGQAWVDLIMLANHKRGFIYVRGVRVEIQRGQLGWSEESLAQRWKWSKGKVRGFMKHLEIDKQIDQQNSRIINLRSIVNYDKYQHGDQQNDQQNDRQNDQLNDQQSDQQSDRQNDQLNDQQSDQQSDRQNDTNKNVKNDNTENKEERCRVRKFIPPTLEEMVAYFLEKGYTKESAGKAFGYYSEGEWKDKTGTPVKNWKQKVLSVWFKPENKIKNRNIFG
jgi:hypothetical protein